MFFHQIFKLLRAPSCSKHKVLWPVCSKLTVCLPLSYLSIYKRFPLLSPLTEISLISMLNFLLLTLIWKLLISCDEVLANCCNKFVSTSNISRSVSLKMLHYSWSWFQDAALKAKPSSSEVIFKAAPCQKCHKKKANMMICTKCLRAYFCDLVTFFLQIHRCNPPPLSLSHLPIIFHFCTLTSDVYGSFIDGSNCRPHYFGSYS